MQSEIHFINATLDRLDLEMQQLQAMQAKLRKRLNELNASTGVLPSEILALIFEAVCTPSKDLEHLEHPDPYYPILLGSVCAQWRGVVRSSPMLWNTLFLEINDQDIQHNRTLGILQMYYQLVAQSPAALKIAFDKGDSAHRRMALSTAYSAFGRVLSSYSSKVNTLILSQVPPNWRSLLHSLSGSFPLLERFSISWKWGTDGIIKVFPNGAAPRLKRVALRGRDQLIELPWSQITFLELEGLKVEQCIELFAACPSLIHYVCRYPARSRNQVDELRLQNVHLHPHLNFLRWEFGLADWDTTLMTYLHFPSLRKMIWEKHRESDQRFGHIVQLPYHNLRYKFLLRMTQLVSFETSLLLWTANDLFNSLPDSVEELHLTKAYLQEDEVLRCLHLLSLTDSDQSHNHLPRLKVLGLADTQIHYNHPIVKPMLQMLQSRRDGPSEKWRSYARLECLRLPERSLSSFEGRVWFAPELSDFRRLVQEGMKLELVGWDGQLIQWSGLALEY